MFILANVNTLKQIVMIMMPVLMIVAILILDSVITLKKYCDDYNECTVDSCDPYSGEWQYIETDCDDYDACTLDGCDPFSGECEHEDKDCDDGDNCTDDSCDSYSGHCKNVEISCEDKILCTEDACDPYSGCVHTPRNEYCDSYDLCKIPRCDIYEGCILDDKNCDDGDACTVDSCIEGECQNHPHNLCNDYLRCTTDICSPKADYDGKISPALFDCDYVFDKNNCGYLASCQEALCTPEHDCQVLFHDDRCPSDPYNSCLLPECTSSGCGYTDVCSSGYYKRNVDEGMNVKENGGYIMSCSLFIIFCLISLIICKSLE